MKPRPLIYAAIYAVLSFAWWLMNVDSGQIALLLAACCGYWLGVHQTIKELFHPKSES